LYVQRSSVAAGALIADVRENVNAASFGTTAAIVGYVDGVQAEISIPGGPFVVLNAVMSKINVFVDVVDEIASVRDPTPCGPWLTLSGRYTLMLRWHGKFYRRCTG
jgi:hypothetical protein